jgi:5-methyltetrahydropteroyltriglutamate--homocysteine methyltransferase
MPPSRDRRHFPGAYARQDALDTAATSSSSRAAAGDDGEPGSGGMVLWACTGPMSYDPAAQRRDIANFTAVLADAQVTDTSQVFMPVVAPASAYWLRNEYYATDEEFVFALADVMRVAALNHALRGLPEDRIRYHICFGSWHGPHAYDPPLRDNIDMVLRVNAKYYLMEQANPAHEHEWRIWEDVPLPEGKVRRGSAGTSRSGRTPSPARCTATRLTRACRRTRPSRPSTRPRRTRPTRGRSSTSASC